VLQPKSRTVLAAYVLLHEALTKLKLEALGARAECLTDNERSGRLRARLVVHIPCRAWYCLELSNALKC
jgi:hypothetical protein